MGNAEDDEDRGNVWDAVRTHEDAFETSTYEGRRYRHLGAPRGALERGTVVAGDTVVRGFPKVPRTLVLDPGVERYFDGEVVVEEKLNGYNTRVATVPALTPDADGPAPVAFTRGGIVCPFTTWKVRHWLDPAFFADNPDLQVCGEVVGPENPYTVYDYPEVDSLAFRAFDVRDCATGDPLPVDERRALLAEYGIPTVPDCGRAPASEAADHVDGVVRDLERDGREGVVMKSADGRRQLKYTTGASNRDNLRYAFHVPFDYGRDFLFSRVVREAFQSVERGEADAARADRARALGEAILDPMVDSIDAVADGETVGEDHTVRGPPAVVDELLEHFDEQGLRIEVLDDRREAGDRVLSFRKVLSRTNDKTSAYLDGETFGE